MVLSLFLSLLILIINLYTWVLVIYALMSWIPQISSSVFGRFIRRIVEPYLHLFDGIPTRIGIFDFKVFLGIIALILIEQFLRLIFG